MLELSIYLRKPVGFDFGPILAGVRRFRVNRRFCCTKRTTRIQHPNVANVAFMTCRGNLVFDGNHRTFTCLSSIKGTVILRPRMVLVVALLLTAYVNFHRSSTCTCSLLSRRSQRRLAIAIILQSHHYSVIHESKDRTTSRPASFSSTCPNLRKSNSICATVCVQPS